MDMTAALDAAAGQTVNPGDFDQRVPRTAASQPAGGGGSPQPAGGSPVSPGGSAGGSPPMPAPAAAGGQPGAARPGAPAAGQPQPRTAAPPAGQQPAPGSAVPLPGQPAAGAAASQPWSLRSQLQGLGFDTAAVQDDQGAWQLLAQRLALWNQSAQQNAHYAQAGQYYLANKGRIDQLLAAGATPAQAVAGAQGGQPGVQGGAGAQPAGADRMKNLFGAPEFDPRWEQIVRLDPNTGTYVVPMGADPAIALKYADYKQWQRSTFDKFMADPMTLLGPAVQDLVKTEAAKIAQQQVGGFADQQFATQYVQQQPWMVQRDQAGNVVLDPMSGQALLTPAGLRFRSYVDHCQKMGVTDVRQQAQWATAMVERDAAMWELSQLRAGQPAGGGNPPAPAGGGQPGGAAATDAAQRAAALGLNGARRIAGGGGQGTPPPAGGTAVRRPIGRGSLRNRLSGALAQSGIN